VNFNFRGMAPSAEPEATDGEFIEQAIQPVKDAQGHIDRLEIENFKFVTDPSGASPREVSMAV